MADPIKGKDYENYSGDLRRGILLHRKIDSFTDVHPTVYKSAHRLFKRFRHYNGVINDVFYDHFLAKNWTDYHNQNLDKYIAEFYDLIDNNFDRLPPQTQYLFPYMKKQNWLLSYKDTEGIEQILYRMSQRIKGGYELDKAIDELEAYYADYEREFTSFFSEIRSYVEQEKKRIK